MTAKKPARDSMSYKVKTASAGCEYKGALDEGIHMAFYYVETTERRLALIEKLKAAHERILASEAAGARE